MSTDLLDIQEQLRRELEVMRDNLPQTSVGRIKTKGKKFTLPGGQPEEGPIDVIILDWVFTNTYYEGTYNPNSISPPACSAVGRSEAEMKPFKSSPSAQSEDCKNCPKNQWGSATNGGKGKACKNGARIAVIPPNPKPDTTPLVIDVTPTGLTGFIKYIKHISSKGWMPLQVSTEIDFDPKADYPTLVFKTDGPHEHLQTAFALRDAARAVLEG